ncbi:MAG TPA: glycosyltransferase [Sphingomonas sp.]|uniref:glycosyltransferase n=1 Tax=Sphingomonas sp. TaxID=28214 RepID=UPI002CFE49BE|nr:glycosyltransferase [Sphingomonas sp.]HMI19957.1 glycosyltransferase [Sphingomonas sp.]
MLEALISDFSLRPEDRHGAAHPATDPGAARRILIVLHDFAGGGTERVAIRLANQWARMGRTVRIFCGCQGGPLRRLVEPGITVETADPGLPRGPLSRVRLGLALAGAARRFQPDAVFGPGNFHLLPLAVFALRSRSGAAIFCKISNPLDRADRTGTSGWIRRRVLKVLTARIDGLVAMSPALRAEAEALIGPDRVAARWEPIFDAGPRRQAEIARDPTLIVAAGRLEPQKNFALAIEAMAHLVRWTDAQLVILGDGSERAQLGRQIERLGLHERVRLIGHVPHIEPWLSKASCFLMTSRYEGYPASLVEALANGLPAVVTPCSPALSEIMPRAGLGVVVTPDAGTIACALQGMMRQPRRQSIDPLLLARHDEARAAASYLDLMDRGAVLPKG